MIYLVVRILILWFYNLNYDGSLIIILIGFVLAISLARIIIPNIIIIREGKDCLIFLMEERFIDVPFRAWAEFAFPHHTFCCYIFGSIMQEGGMVFLDGWYHSISGTFIVV